MFWQHGVFLFFLFLLGLSFGSFLNVLIYRLPRRLSPVSPPSSCPHCAARLTLPELIPLAGFFLFSGRCRYCEKSISWRYPLVELATACLFLVVYLSFGFSGDTLFYLLFLYLLLGIALIDLEHRIVPNTLVASGLLGGLILLLPRFFAPFPGLSPTTLPERAPREALLGLLLGGGLLLLIHLVSRGGMGLGDVKLAALIGFYLGPAGTLLALMLSFIVGALVSLVLMGTGRLTRKDAIPFAPFLAAGAAAVVFWGRQIIHWYIGLLG